MSSAQKQWLTQKAQALGFNAIGFADPRAADYRKELDSYLAKNYHGQMHWLGERVHWRSAPSALWPECRSVIMLAQSYPAPQEHAAKNCGEISGLLIFFKKKKKRLII